MSEMLDPQNTPVADPPAAPADGGTPSGGPSPVSLSDDALVTIRVGNEDKVLPWKEARSGFMMHSDYTRKTQEVAEQRRAFEQQQQQFQTQQQQYEQRLSQFSNVLKDPNKLAQLYMLANSQAQPTGPQPLTTDAIPHLQQNLEQRLQQNFERFQQQILAKQEASRIEADLDASLKNTLTKYPLLSAIPGIEDTIYGRVAALSPRSIEEAKEHARQMVETMDRAVKERQAEQAKQEALAKAQATNGIEPRGGAPVLPKPQQFKNAGDRDQAILALLEGFEKATF